MIKANNTLNCESLISVVISTLNVGNVLQRTLDSILSQTYKNTELIIIDGGSTDSTLSVLKENNSNIDFWISEKDSGIYCAWNKALNKTNGKWVIFLGAGDILFDTALEDYMSYVKKSKIEYDFISSKIRLVSKSSSRIIGSSWNWDIFKCFMNVAHVGALHNHDLFRRLGAFDETYQVAADYEFLLRLGDGLRAGFLDQVIGEMRDGGKSTSYSALFEAHRAKIVTGNRNHMASYFELACAYIKLTIRSALGRL